MQILIAGGTGFIGSHFSRMLEEDGHKVKYLSRSQTGKDYFHWNAAENEIDQRAFEGTDILINLAGAGISDRLWTKKRRKLILRSRVQSTQVLADGLAVADTKPKLVINASAVGYYGNRPGEILKESDEPGHGFLAEVTTAWEQEAEAFASLGIPLAVLRIGVVLGMDGGILPVLSLPLKMRMNVVFGGGKHHMPWIHITDLSRISKALIEGEIPPAVYNATAPAPATQKMLNAGILHAIERKAIPINLPKFLLNILPGGMSELVISDQNVIPQGLMDEGFNFEYDDLDKALEEIFGGS